MWNLNLLFATLSIPSGSTTTKAKKVNQYQTLYEASARLGTNAEKFFDTSWGNATKLRHKISPTIYYTYQGYHNDGEETPWYSPIEQDDYGTPWYLTSSQDEKNQDRNRVTFSLENFLDAKMEDKKGMFRITSGLFFGSTRDTISRRPKRTVKTSRLPR
jgi:hypothetical protein